jgi:fumarate reductase subunit D
MEQRELMLMRGCGDTAYPLVLLVPVLLLILGLVLPLYNNVRTRLCKSELNLCTKNASHDRSVVVFVVDDIFVFVAMDNMSRPRFSLCVYQPPPKKDE